MSAAAPAQGSSRWLWGPVPDLLLGCGAWYVLAFFALCALGSEIRLAGGLAVLPVLTLVFGTPHYGATLLRVYRRPEDRRAYRIFVWHATILIFAVFAVGVHSALVGSAIVTLYLTWSPWHYAGQNYGIGLMLLRRRGLAPSPGLKRLFYLSFFLSFALTFLAQHGGGTSALYAPLSYEGASYVFLPLGIPDPFAGWAIAAVGAGYLVATLAAAAGIVRAGGFGTALPALVMMFSQSLWFSIPMAARHWGFGQQFEPLGAGWSEYYFIWIAVAHSVQYLWVTSYYARSQGDRSSLAAYSTQAMLAGAIIWAVPALLFAPDLLGRLSFSAGLGILVAATVNIHHFVLDGAIWKLRDGRVARILLRRASEGEAAPLPSGSPWRRRAVWATGAACTFVIFYGMFEPRLTDRALARRDLPAVTASLERMRWIGRDNEMGHRALGDLHAEDGRLLAAEREYQRSIALRPDPSVWQSMAEVRARGGNLPGAGDAFREALVLAPESDVLHYEYGVLLELTGELEAARDAFARAVELNPRRGINRHGLERVEARLAKDPAS